MSLSVPGSWPRNLLHGTPTIARPSFANFSCSSSSGLYCGVLPHLLATFTSSTTLPLYFSARFTLSPSSVFISTSSGLDLVVLTELFAEAPAADAVFAILIAPIATSAVANRILMDGSPIGMCVTGIDYKRVSRRAVLVKSQGHSAVALSGIHHVN